jgi:Skp family chaperone for outer membrane proteins
MKTLLIGGAAAAAILAAGAAFAQAAPVAPAAPRAPQAHFAKPQTRADVQAHVSKLFAKLDTNRDGFVTKAEADAVHAQRAAKIGQRMAERGARTFERLDANKDGQISRQEWDSGRQMRQQRIAAGEPAPGGRMDGMHRMGGMHRAGMGFGGHMFAMADVNKDGRVSLAEAQQVALQHFDRADVNRDGTLTPEERRQAHQLMRAQRNPS